MKTFERLDPVQFPLVNRFYKQAGHKGKARGNDIVFVMRENGAIVAAARFCPAQPPHSDWLLLRGMWVLPDKQRQGMGSELMKFMMHHLFARKVWCYPFSHLEGFYGQFGFERVDAFECEAFIKGPYEAYSRAGKNIITMQYMGVS